MNTNDLPACIETIGKIVALAEKIIDDVKAKKFLI